MEWKNLFPEDLPSLTLSDGNYPLIPEQDLGLDREGREGFTAVVSFPIKLFQRTLGSSPKKPGYPAQSFGIWCQISMNPCGIHPFPSPRRCSREQIIASKILQQSSQKTGKNSWQIWCWSREEGQYSQKTQGSSPANPGMKDVVVVAGVADGSPGSHGIVTRIVICHWDCSCSCSWEKIQIFLSWSLEISVIPFDDEFDHSNPSWSRD